jgi:hypothetical protein
MNGAPFGSAASSSVPSAPADSSALSPDATQLGPDVCGDSNELQNAAQLIQGMQDQQMQQLRQQQLDQQIRQDAQQSINFSLNNLQPTNSSPNDNSVGSQPDPPTTDAIYAAPAADPDQN